MNIIKELFSTSKRAAISIAAILLVGIIAGTAITFAAVWKDVRGNANEEPTAQVVIEGAEERATETPAAEAPVAETPASDATAAEAPVPDAAEAGAAEKAAANETPANDAANHQKITQKKAEEIALKDAGLSRSSVDNIFSHYELDDGVYQYEVQIYKGLYEYEYNISADTGNIIEKDIDYIYD